MTTLRKTIFREYDIRGLADSDFTEENVLAIGKAIGSLARDRGARTLAVGYDCRPHSPRIRDAVVRGLRSTGLSIVDIGMCPTPVLYFSVPHWGLDGGVMVTASHNPSPDNGFKIQIGKSTLHGDEIRALHDRILAGKFVEESPGALEERPILDEYIAAVLERVGANRKLKIAVDAGNGPGGLTAVPILRALGHELVEIHCEPDGTFPNHHPDPTVAENLEDLIRAVRENGCDFGVAFDGDADRIGAVDEKGTILWGDQILHVLARALIAEGKPGPFLADVKCSQTLYDDVAAKGGKILMWKTGHSLIKQKMREEDAILAGEMSGHIFFADRWFGFDDAVYSAARLAEVVAGGDVKVSELLDDVPKMIATPEIRLECPEERKFEVVDQLKRELSEKYESTDVDGIRFRSGGGWGLVRASNTGPVLVLRFEAQDRKTLERLQSEVETRIEEILSA